MLGKGLESLIPPNQGKKPDPASGAVVPSGESANLSRNAQAEPPVALPVEPIEETLLDNPINPARELPANDEPAYASQEPVNLPPPEDVKAEPVPAAHGFMSPALAARQKPSREHGDAIFYLEVGKIKPNEQQPRRHFDEETIRELASSIREFGILQPIVVTKKEKDVPTGTEVEYELIAGERRLLAARSLGMERIPAIIRHVDMERERLELAIIENLQREDLNGIEMARAFSRLQDEFRLTQREIAARLGKSRESVANTMRLLDLPSYIQEAIAKGQITASHGLFLIGVDDPAVQQALFHDLLNQKLTIREMRHKLRVIRKNEPEGIAEGTPAEIKIFEEKLASELGAPVSIRQKGESGKITIDFYSKEELEELIRRLGGADE